MWQWNPRLFFIKNISTEWISIACNTSYFYTYRCFIFNDFSCSLSDPQWTLPEECGALLHLPAQSVPKAMYWKGKMLSFHWNNVCHSYTLSLFCRPGRALERKRVCMQAFKYKNIVLIRDTNVSNFQHSSMNSQHSDAHKYFLYKLFSMIGCLPFLFSRL